MLSTTTLQDSDSWVVATMSMLSFLQEKAMPMHQWLHDRIAALGVDDWAAMLDSAFPPDPKVTYLSADEQEPIGSRQLRLWQLSYHVDSGNSGIMVQEDMETLTSLIVSAGFLTDADNIGGVEKLASKMPDKVFVDAYKMITLHPKHQQLAPMFGVWHVKGWKRSVAALAVATVIAEGGHADELKSKMPDIHNSFCTVHAVFDRHDGPLSAIMAARAITMASAATRRMPNCFNHLHQMRKMEVLGCNSGNDAVDWNKKTSVMRAFNIGPAEAAAALNLARHLTQDFVENMQRLVQRHGFIRGPLTHAALALECIRVGKGPAMASMRWAEDLRNDTYSLSLLARRIELDWEATPKSMRKSFTPQQMAQKQIICATFNKARLTLKTLIPDAMFIVEFPILEQRFLEQLMDAELELAAQNQSDPWGMDELSDIKAILRRMEASTVARDREKHREVMMRAELACFDQLSTELAMDQEDATKYLEKKAAAGRAWDREVAHYKAKRYNRGLEMAKKFLADRFSIVDIPDAKHLVREIVMMRRRLEQDIICSGRVAMMFFLDLNVDHGAAAIASLKPITDMLQQSEDNCLLFMYPQTHNNLKLTSKLKIERLFEDKLLASNMNIDSEASMHYTIADEHASDRRQLQSRLRVVVANDYLDSKWLQSRAARGNLGEAPLVKVRDMALPASRVKCNPTSYRPHPADRAAQRGAQAMKHILTSVMAGMDFKQGDRLHLVNVNVGEFAEMAHAVMDMVVNVGEPVPLISFQGFYINKASEAGIDPMNIIPYSIDGGKVVGSESLPVNQIFLKRLLDEWWDKQPEAGPKELSHSSSGLDLARPPLRICTWCEDIPLIIESVANKLPEGGEVLMKWQTLVAQHRATFGEAPAQQAKASDGVVIATPHQTMLNGPDFSAEPQPRDVNASIELPSDTSRPEFKAVAEGRKKGQPSVGLDKAGHLWLFVNDHDDQSVAIGPCELIGFGKGDFVPLEDEGNWVDGIVFKFDSDVAHIVMTGDKRNKTLMTIASAIYEAAVKHGIPGVELQSHLLHPKVQSGQALFHRYDVLLRTSGQSKPWGFKPDPLPPADEGQVVQVRHVELGALMCPVITPPPHQAASIVWEISLCTIPPSSLNMVKPKLWLLGKLNMEQGVYYMLQ